MSAHARWVIPMLIAVSCCARGAEPAKPVCNAQTQGDLWPEKAARASVVPIEICSKTHRKYHWRQLTVDVSQLKNPANRKPIIANVATVTRTKVGSAATPQQ